MRPPFTKDKRVPWHLRRGVGFTIKARIGEPEACRVIVKRHGQEKEQTLPRGELRALMALDRFTPLQALDLELMERLEACDLVYYAEQATARSTSGRPIGAESAACVALRDGVSVTLAIEDDDAVTPWIFMPRRGAFDDKKLRGARFSSLERGSEVYALDLYGDAKEVRALRALLPRLNGRERFSDLLRAHPDTASVVSILGWLDDAGLLSAEAPPSVFVGDEPESYVCWLGHAAVLVRMGGKRILIDPLAIRRSQPSKPWTEEGFDFRRLPPIDCICITHGDNDHLNPPTLARLPQHVPIVIPAPVAKKPYQVDIGEVLGFLGFDDVHALKEGERFEIGGAAIEARAFEGEDWGLVLQKATYLVSSQEGRVYLGTDSACSDETLQALAKTGPIDFAFLGVSGCEEPLVSPPGFGYGELYALWLPRALRNAWIRHTDGPEDAARAARLIGARQVFGYAAGGAFMDMSHSDHGAHADLAALLVDAHGPQPVDLALGVPRALSG